MYFYLPTQFKSIHKSHLFTPSFESLPSQPLPNIQH